MKRVSDGDDNDNEGAQDLCVRIPLLIRHVSWDSAVITRTLGLSPRPSWKVGNARRGLPSRKPARLAGPASSLRGAKSCPTNGAHLTSPPRVRRLFHVRSLPVPPTLSAPEAVPDRPEDHNKADG